MKIILTALSCIFVVGCSSLSSTGHQTTVSEFTSPSDFRKPANELKDAAKGLAGNVINLGNDKINIERFPWLCTTRDPWNRSSEAYATTRSAAKDQAVSKCGIFPQCKSNINCVDRKAKQTTDQPAKPEVGQNQGPVIIERCTDNSSDLRAAISRLSLANDRLSQSFSKLNSSHKELTKTYKALYEVYVLPKQTSKEKIILACSNKFEYESDVSQCVAAAAQQNASTGDIGYCGSYTEYYGDFENCMVELKVNNVPVERFEACKTVSTYWSDRAKCLKY